MQPGLQFGQFLDGRRPPGLQLGALLHQPLPFGLGVPRLLAQPAQLLVDRRDRRVGFVQRGQRLLGRILAGRLLLLGTGQGGRQLTGLTLYGREFRSGLLDFGRDLQCRHLAVRTAADPACPHQITIGGRDAQLRTFGHQIQRRQQVIHHRHPGQQGADRAAQPFGRLDQIDRPLPAGGERLAVVCLLNRPVAEQDRRPPAVGLLQRGHGGACGADILGGQRVGRRAEHRRHRDLVAGAYPHQLGHRTEKPCTTVVFRQPGRTVLAFQTHRQRIDAGVQ